MPCECDAAADFKVKVAHFMGVYETNNPHTVQYGTAHKSIYIIALIYFYCAHAVWMFDFLWYTSSLASSKRSSHHQQHAAAALREHNSIDACTLSAVLDPTRCKRTQRAATTDQHIHTHTTATTENNNNNNNNKKQITHTQPPQNQYEHSVCMYMVLYMVYILYITDAYKAESNDPHDSRV